MESTNILLIVFGIILINAVIGEYRDMVYFAPACSIFAECIEGNKPLYVTTNGNTSPAQIKTAVKRHIRSIEKVINWRVAFIVSLFATMILYAASKALSIKLNNVFLTITLLLIFIAIKVSIQYINYHYTLYHLYRIDDYVNMYKD